MSMVVLALFMTFLMSSWQSLDIIDPMSAITTNKLGPSLSGVAVSLEPRLKMAKLLVSYFNCNLSFKTWVWQFSVSCSPPSKKEEPPFLPSALGLYLFFSESSIPVVLSLSSKNESSI